MSTITVYTAPGCTQCKFTKKYLNQKGLSYNEVDLSTNDDARDSLISQGFSSVPVVDLGDGEKFFGFRPERIDNFITKHAAA